MSRGLKFVISAGVWLVSAPVLWLRRMAGLKPPRRCVILCYHVIRAKHRQRFARQMDDLLRYATPLNLEDCSNAESPGLHVAVTFDDAFAGVAEYALPELAARGIPCTIFVPTGHLGRKPTWAGASLDPDPALEVMSAEQLRRIASPLVSFGSHTVKHPFTEELDEAQIRWELEQSRTDLRPISGKDVELFAFPYGAHADRVCAVAQELGYRHLFTGIPEWNCMPKDALVVGRTSAGPEDSVAEFRLKLWGAYAWIAAASRLKRRLMALIGARPAAIRPLPSSVDTTELPRTRAARKARAGAAADLPEGFAAEVDAVGEPAWHDLVQQFRDATIYQSWPYEEVLWGRRRMSHLVLRRDGEAVAAAQVRIVRAPLTGAGIAYIYRGPMWRRADAAPKPEVMRAMLAALRREYASRRGLLLRIVPNEPEESEGVCAGILVASGCCPRASMKPYRTILMDLTPSLETLRKGLKHQWRNNLNKSERREFTVSAGTSDAEYAVFLELYRQMHDRKGFVQHVDVDAFREIQARLPESLKMTTMICRLDGEPVSAGTCSLAGNTGIQIFLANSDKALEVQSAYQLIWRQIQWLKERGCRYYDIGGVDPVENPGGYRFKSGLCGAEVLFVGEFEVADRALSALLVRGAEAARARYRDSHVWWTRSRRSAASEEAQA